MALKLAPQKACRALIWLASQEEDSTDPVGLGYYDEVISILQGINVCVDEVLDPDVDFWTGNIQDYRLVFIDVPGYDPIWWSDINYTGTPPDWRGRIVLISEQEPISPDDGHFDWINGLTATTGLTVTPATSGGNGTVEADALTAGQGAPMEFEDSSTVSGGTILSYDTTPDGLLTHNEVETIDWVLIGDSNFFAVPYAATNAQFIENLWTVALP